MTFPLVILALICVIFGVFAFAIPIPLLIMPLINKDISYIGIWNPALATILICAGILLGALAYFFIAPKKRRVVSSFVGGEDPELLEKVSGVEFYNTIKEIGWLDRIYSKEEAHELDIYDIGRRTIVFFTGYLQRLANGILPTYIVWCLLGMIAMFIVLFVR